MRWPVQYSTMAIVAVVALATSRVAGAQLHGVVRDSGSLAPLAGAVVAVVDSAGATAARTIADAGGRFVLSAAPRAARLHVIRIGYEPRDVPLPGPGESVSIAMLRVPPVLNTVHVSGAELCPGSADRGAAFQLWEQARAGLLASVVAREANPALVTSLLVRRTVAPDDNLVLEETANLRTARTTRPFVATAPASTFARTGYVVEDTDGSRLYSAPDADVLLDESFAATHCFRLRAGDDAHQNQIGLAFAPIAGRDTLVDVDGVIWLDRPSPALRQVEFRYTGLEPVAKSANIGGSIDFRTMSNGVAFIEYWMLRLPVMTQVATGGSSLHSTMIQRGPLPPQRGDRRAERVNYRLVQIRETAGLVVAAAWDDSTQWTAPLTAIDGSVMRKDGGGPVASAIVRIQGSTESTLTDARGQFRLAPLVGGRYTVVVTDTALAGFSAERTQSQVVAVPRGTVASMRTELPSMAGALRTLCRGVRSSPGTTMIVGRVDVPGDGQLRDGSVRAAWSSLATGGAVSESTRTSTVDGAGRFVICAVPVDRRIALRLSQPGLLADTTLVAPDGVYTSLHWALGSRIH